MAPIDPGQIAVVLICKNEAGGLPQMLEGLLSRYDRWIREIIVVDDHSTDGSPEAVRKWMARSPKVRLIEKGPPSGPGAALKIGLAAVGEESPWVLSMDSDFVECLSDVEALLAKAGEGVDGVIGSRFAGGARLSGYPLSKRVANRAFHQLARWIFHFSQQDLTNNFKLYRRSVFAALPLQSDGFAINAETGLFPVVAGFKIAEAPVRWIQRKSGRSHFRLWREGTGYAGVLWRAWKFRKRGQATFSHVPCEKVACPHLDRLSVFFPCYNEAENLRRLLAGAPEVLKGAAREWEILVVDDGSADGTAAVAETFQRKDPRIRTIRHSQNQGYGGALRTGFAETRYDAIFYSDADGQFDLAQLNRLLDLYPGADLVCGFRIARQDPWYRRFNGWAYNRLVRILFGLKHRDIDCGFKLLRRRVLDEIPLKSPSQFISAELLIKAHHRGFRIVQVGVDHKPRWTGKPTGNSLRAILGSFRDLFRLWKELKQR